MSAEEVLVRPRILAPLVASLYLGGPTCSLAEEFYAGRTITLATFALPGGSYDTYLRILSRYMGKYIPGHPSIIVMNQPGAGGFVAANYAGNVAPKDGTFATLMNVGLIVQGALRNPTLRTGLSEFNWLGNFSRDNYITVTSARSSVKTINDAIRSEVPLGSLGAGSIDAQVPILYNQLLGTKFKLIYGYDSTPKILAAMERGEVDGETNIWPTLKSVIPNDGARRLNILIQIGPAKDPELPRAPLLLDLVRGNNRKEAVARFVTLATMMSRPLAAPPNVPIERIQILRRAFDSTVNDPEFVDLAGRAGFNVNPMTGPDVQSAIKEVLAAPPETLDEVRNALSVQPR